MGWANRITMGRALLTIVLWVILAADAPTPATGVWWAAFVLFVFTALTDLLDGALARRFGDVSRFGRIADPLVDKLLVIGTMVVLLGIDGVRTVLPAWIVAAFLTREIVITALRGAVEGRGVNFQASRWGKLKTQLQCYAIGGALLHGAEVGWVRAEVGFLSWLPGPAGTWNPAHLVTWLALLVTLASGLDYMRKARAAFRSELP